MIRESRIGRIAPRTFLALFRHKLIRPATEAELANGHCPLYPHPHSGVWFVMVRR